MNKKRAADFLVIIIVFSIAGITTMYISDFILSALNIRRWSPAYFLLIPFVLMPLHNILLLFYSAFFGKFGYFWEREKKIVRFILGRNKKHAE
jgi:energy-coupling factor transporter transmembrane protein EcfT